MLLEIIIIVSLALVLLSAIVFNAIILQKDNLKEQKKLKIKYVYVLSHRKGGVMEVYKKPDVAIKKNIDFLWDMDIKNRALSLYEYERELKIKSFVILSEDKNYRIDKIILY